jgi:hypothetical protein
MAERTGEGTGGGRGGTVSDGAVTNGGRDGTSGGHRVRLVGWAILIGFVLVDMIVNAQSVIDERARMGRWTPDWMPWTWEASSAVGWLAVMPIMAFAAIRLRPPHLSWPVAVVAHALVTVPVSLMHVGIMVAIRKVVHGLMGGVYRLTPDLPQALLYEWRKDAVNYVAIVIAFAIIDRLAHRDGTRPRSPMRIEVRDGQRTIWLLPAEILWAQAAGNYVELHTAAGTLLHRATLANLERELGAHGFARIHRSRIVRRDAVRSIETNASGDFEAVLTDGAKLVGSRRYRAALDA